MSSDELLLLLGLLERNDPDTIKPEDLKEINELVKKIESVSEFSSLNPRGQYIIGKSLVYLNERGDQAESLLGRSIKLDPSNIDAWNILAQSYYKRGNFSQAKSCFLESLNRKRGSVALQDYSMLLRTIPTKSQEDMFANLKQSLALAKESVAITKGDSKSWYNLGNALMTIFTKASTEVNDLEKALKAFNKADSLGEGEKNPDLHFNRATINRYLENYQDSVDGFTLAAKMASDLAEQSKENINNIENHVIKLYETMEKKAKIKAKNLEETSSSFSMLPKSCEGGKNVLIKDLKLGVNEGSNVTFRLLFASRPQDNLPGQLICSDREGECINISLFISEVEKHGLLFDNLSLKDTLTVKDPILKEIKLTTSSGNKINFNAIQILKPLSSFFVNQSTFTEFSTSAVKN